MQYLDNTYIKADTKKNVLIIISDVISNMENVSLNNKTNGTTSSNMTKIVK